MRGRLFIYFILLKLTLLQYKNLNNKGGPVIGYLRLSHIKLTVTRYLELNK